ncbi:MAG: hypothetical protein WDN47_01895 [Candidatus Doudnabacteria bacterium]
MNKEPNYLGARESDTFQEKHRQLIGMLSEKIDALAQAAASQDESLAEKRLAEYKALKTEMIFANPGWPISEEDKMLADKAEALTYKLHPKNLTTEPMSLSELKSVVQEDIDKKVEDENRRLNTKKLD